MTGSTQGWLSPYRVLDLTDERGLLAGQMFAKLGADVVQIEPPAGCAARRVDPLDTDGRSFFWSAYAAGKRSVVLDLETTRDRAVLIQLVRAADFLFESARSGEMERLGLDEATLRRINPSLIHVSITPFGATGPKRDWADAELILWAAGGPLYPNRDTEGPPLRISVPQAYLHAAADAAAGALIAHFARLKSGRGQQVDISVQQSVAQATLSSIVAAAIGDQRAVAAQGAAKPGAGKALDLSGSGSRTRRSKWVVSDGLAEMHLGIGPAAGGQSNNLFAWMREEGALPARFEAWDWVALPARLKAGEVNEDDLEAARDAVAAFLRPRSKFDLLREAIARKIQLAPVNDVGDLLLSPQLAARGFFVRVDENGVERVLPGAFAYGPQDMFAAPAPAPGLGEHTDSVLSTWLTATPGSSPQPDVKPVGAPGLRPLEGLKVLDLAWVVAGPAIGRVLADYGATVVRVESSVRVETARLMGPFPEGRFDRERSALYDNYNTGKLGLALDLGMDAGRQVVRDLAAWADVVVESFAPGQMARWGLSAESLRAANPALIGVSTSLMGQTGPASGFGGYGNVGAAVAGYQAIVGREGALPIGPYGPYTDFIGPRFGVVALLAALERRRATGEGCWLDIAQAEAGIQFLAPQIAAGAALGLHPAAAGNRDPRFAPHGVFRSRGDDEWVAIVARNDEEWRRLALEIGGEALRPAFATLAGRKADESALETLLGAWTLPRSAEETQARLQALGVPAHKASNSADMVADPQLAARGHFIRLAHPLGGESVVEASRYALSETPARYERCAPHFGRDAETVLSSILGYAPDRIAELEARGVLR